MTAPRPAPSLALSVAATLCLSACSVGPPGAAVGRYPAAAGVDRGPVLASLPAAAGRVVAVRRIPYANGVGQEIVLDGPRAMSGENRITVQALTTAATGLRGQGAEELRIGPATDTEIEAEMDRALPGVAMQLSPAPAQVERGTVGYATGTAGRLSCLYAWQYLAPAHPLSLLEGAIGTGALPSSIRVRLCRERPVAALVATLRGLRVFDASNPDGSAGPTAALPGDALTAAVGSPAAVPDDAVADAAPVPTGRARPARRHRRTRRRFAAPRFRAAARAAAFRRAPSIRRRRDPPAAFAALPRVPMPGDATVSLTAAGITTATDPGLPMPR